MRSNILRFVATRGLLHAIGFAWVMCATGGCAMHAADTGSQPPSAETRARIGVLETTDIHSNVMSYDFYKLSDDPSLGLARTATLIHAARTEFENTLLFDAGDTIQGTVLADYQALVKPVACDAELGVYKAMDTLGYDAATIGNHEFNYGLEYLSGVTGVAFDVAGIKHEKCHGPNFPFVLSNVFSTKDGKPLFAPWRIVEKKIHTRAMDGSMHEATLHIGIVGFTPPGIMDWDKRNLDGKVTVMGVVEAAQKYVPEVRNAGADIVIALVHGGIDASPYSAHTENAAWYLAGVAGIDVMLLGHSHDIFPNPGNPKSRYANVREVDNRNGSVRGVPAVMGNYFGKSLGVIDLALLYRDGHWQVDRAATHAQVRSVKNADGTYVAPDAAIAQTIASEQAATIAYVQTPIGRSEYAISTYFVGAGDTSALQIVNMAQQDFVQKYIKQELPQYAELPVLSAASPFKAGFGGPRDYTDVPAGPIAINNAADLYLYPNTVTAVKIDGAGVKAWLEKSAGWFNRIDPARSEPQLLLNTRFPTFNFDVLQGELTYAIDVTRPTGKRIVDLEYRGKPIDSAAQFIVVTNNYRASGGGGFPGVSAEKIVVSVDATNRDTLIAYIRAQHVLDRKRFGSDRNWHFVPVKTSGPVILKSASGKMEVAVAANLHNIKLWKDNGDGSSDYAVDLSR